MIALYVAKTDDEYGTYCKAVPFESVKDQFFQSKIPFRVAEAGEVTSIVVNTDRQYLDHRDRAADELPNKDADHYFLVFMGLLHKLVGQCGCSEVQEVYVFAHMGLNLCSASRFECEAQEQMRVIPQLKEWHFAVLRKGGGDRRESVFTLEKVEIPKNADKVKDLYQHLIAVNRENEHDQ